MGAWKTPLQAADDPAVLGFAKLGAISGSYFGPWGTLIGGVGGAIYGGIKGTTFGGDSYKYLHNK